MPARVLFAEPLLRVKNVRRSAEWYTRTLGLKAEVTLPDKKRPSFIRMIAGDPRGFALMFSDGTDPMTGKKPSRAVLDAIGARQAQRVVTFTYRVDKEIDALYRSARRKGAKVVSPIQDMPYGVRQFILRDLDDFEIVVGQEL